MKSNYFICGFIFVLYLKFKRLQSKENSNLEMLIGRNHRQSELFSAPKLDSMSYTIEFPCGSMGLELEPVITSSEREIGCRVRDFYFGLDHVGISAEEIKSKVTIGDIIWNISGENVLSSKFNDILELLKKLKMVKRVVVFKRISSSCE